MSHCTSKPAGLAYGRFHHGRAMPDSWNSQSAIDTFVDARWLEDGLSRNTLAAYRRDLTLYAQWLAQQQPRWRWTPRPKTTCRATLPPPRADARTPRPTGV